MSVDGRQSVTIGYIMRQEVWVSECLCVLSICEMHEMKLYPVIKVTHITVQSDRRTVSTAKRSAVIYMVIKTNSTVKREKESKNTIIWESEKRNIHTHQKKKQK